MTTARLKSIDLGFIDLGFKNYSRADYFRFAALVGAPPLIVLVITFLQPVAAPAALLRDPMAIARDPELCCAYYSGAVSNLGVLLWAAAASIAAFAASLTPAKDTRRFLIATSAVTAFLMIDDLFMLHEEALPQLGAPEPVVYAFYLAGAAAYGLVYFRRILGERAALAILAAFAMAASLIEDQTKILWPIHDFVEDGAKLVAVYCWFLFVSMRSRDALRASQRQA